MESWEAMHELTVADYMHHAEETFATPQGAYEVLDADGDHNSTQQEFQAGSAIFKRPPFRYPADMIPVFNKIDANQDGVIEDTEFYKATPSGLEQKWHINMTDLKVRAKQSYGYLDSYYTAMDINSDGKVDLKEFIAMAKDLEPPVPAEDAEVLFKESDTDGMGFIEPREWVSYNVTGNFTFKANIEEQILPEGPRVMMAVEAGLRACLTIMQFDLLTITGVQDITHGSQTSRRLNETVKFKDVVLRANFVILTGTHARQGTIQSTADSLPNDCFNADFANAIGGGSTTLPPGPSTSAKIHEPGPVSDKQLKDYTDVPAVIQGHTELFLQHAAGSQNSIAQQEGKLAPIFKASVDSFCKCSITVESVQTTLEQDTSGAGLATNKTMVFSWSIDLQQGGQFERQVKEQGHDFVTSIYGNIMKENLPCMKGVKLDSWTRFTATYYGSSARTLPRGVAIQQYTGHKPSAKGIRNDTSTPPFVTHP
jgi:Ca2+-binding EF-hand superfamily protein